VLPKFFLKASYNCLFLTLSQVLAGKLHFGSVLGWPDGQRLTPEGDVFSAAIWKQQLPRCREWSMCGSGLVVGSFSYRHV